MKTHLFYLGALAVGAGLIFVFMSVEVIAQMVKKPSEGTKVDGPVSGEKASQGKTPAEKVTYGFMFPLDPSIVNLAGNGGNRILKVNISLKMSAPEVHLVLKKNILKLTDSILFLLSSKSFENIDSYQDKAKLENEIMIRINKFLTSGQVNGAYFTEFIIQ